MKLEFTWDAAPAGPQATCSAKEPGSNEVCPLACLLMDNGGLDVRTTLTWLREGLARVDAALSGTGKARTNWDREALGAVITEAETNVYSLHDERCAELIPTLEFRRVLVEWLKFIEAGSGSNAVVVDLRQ